MENQTLGRKSYITIGCQLDTKDRIRLPKNRKKRRAYLHPKGYEAFEGWVSRTKIHSHKRLNYFFKKACLKYLNRENLTWHSLRHSYAVFLLGSGVPIQLVAQSLGNTVRVCESNYVGHILSDLGLENVARIMDSASNGLQ